MRPKEKGKISLRIHKKEINGHQIFFFHKTHHFIHGVRKMNISDDFVLDQDNMLLCGQFKPNLIVNFKSSNINTHKIILIC